MNLDVQLFLDQRAFKMSVVGDRANYFK